MLKINKVKLSSFIILNYMMILIQIYFKSTLFLPIVLFVYIISVLSLGKTFIIPILTLYFPFYLYNFDFGFISLKFFEFLVIFSILILIFKRSFEFKKFFFRPLLSYIILLLILGFSLLRSTNISFSISVFFVLIFPILIFTIASNTINNRNEVKITINFLILSGFVQSLIILYQYFTFNSFQILYGLEGSMGNSNRVASFLLFSIVLSLILLIKKRKISLNFFIIFLFQFIAILLTKSRGAWVSLALITIILVLIYLLKKNFISRFLKVTLYISFLSIITINILPSETTESIIAQVESINNLEDRSSSDRIYMWRSAYDMFNENPIFGKGVGNYYNLYPYYRYIGADLRSTSAHSNYIMLLTEAGIIGTTLYLLFLISLIRISYKTILINEEKNYRIILILSWMSFLIQGITNHNMYVVRSSQLFWLLTALILIFSKEKLNEKNNF